MYTQGSNGLLRTLDLCFLDVETTGHRFGFHEIVDMAAIRTSPDGESVRGVWHRRVRPGHPERMTDHARGLTGYERAQWETAHPADQALWNNFVSFVRGAVPVCHNPSFDRAFLTLGAMEAGVNDLELDYHWIGTESLAWPFYRQGRFAKLSLASICDYLGVEKEPDIHTALDGAHACRRAYLALAAKYARHEASDVFSRSPHR